jgi:aryl-alcohol dehydrogenase-like predicted oxidoreductase
LAGIDMSLAFVTSHPAVTAAIIGPRTMEQLESQLAVLERPVLSGEILDKIDEVVAPGTNVNPADTGWDAPWLTESASRRR